MLEVDAPPRARRLGPRAKFTAAEDDILRAAVEELGEDAWSAIAERLPGRSLRQCKDRWCYYLRPGLNTKDWTPDEDASLLRRHAEYGARWVNMAAFFPGRTDVQLKNRFAQLRRNRERGCRKLAAEMNRTMALSCPGPGQWVAVAADPQGGFVPVAATPAAGYMQVASPALVPMQGVDAASPAQAVGSWVPASADGSVVVHSVSGAPDGGRWVEISAPIRLYLPQGT